MARSSCGLKILRSSLKPSRRAVKADGPVVVEALIENKFPYSGTKSYGFWDLLPERKIRESLGQ